jgi:hypothetical protein
VAQAPPPEDATAQIEQLRRQRDSRARRPRCRGASRSWQSSQNVADRYAERILAETDVVKRRALERESKAVVAERRKASRSNSPNAARGSGATSSMIRLDKSAEHESPPWFASAGLSFLVSRNFRRVAIVAKGGWQPVTTDDPRASVQNAQWSASSAMRQTRNSPKALAPNLATRPGTSMGCKSQEAW